MNVLELDQVTVRYPTQRIRSLKEWAIRGAVRRASRDFINALEDVSLTLEEGGALGVIGANGAGKSTLLRVAAGIIQPSRGGSMTRGRVAPVIELGSGFNPELSGRENVYFNGALLGRSRRLLARSFDEIVDFSGLEEFIDSPLRTYSTGMVGRLAFAIATMVDADLILLDEVLSVGDEAFRARCEERIRGFYHRGSAVVLVSHHFDSIDLLCRQTVWLEHGRVRAVGPTAAILEQARHSVPSQNLEPDAG